MVHLVALHGRRDRVVLALVRGNVLRWGSAASSQLYRVAIIATLLNTFFQLREILPLVSPWTDDARIYAFDMKVFGFEPSVFMDRWVTPATTEWFAFFYFLYFLILCVHVLPMVFAQRDTHLLNQFATGALLLFLSSHVIYMMVPGYGPYWYLKDAFAHPLTGGTFWRWVNETVDAASSRPMSIEPESPMKTRAGWKLCGKKPRHMPATMIAISIGGSAYGRCDCTERL